MATLKRYRLRDASLHVPLPDRGGRLFPADENGLSVDIEKRFYANLISEGDLVPVPRSTAKAVPRAKSSKTSSEPEGK